MCIGLEDGVNGVNYNRLPTKRAKNITDYRQNVEKFTD